MKQQQEQFVQNLALQKQEEARIAASQKQAADRANTLLPYMIQQYQDTHKTAASEAQIKDMYRNIIQGALSDNGAPQGQGGTSPMPPQMGGVTPPVAATQSQTVAPTTSMDGERELRPGNPRLAKLDSVAGIVPGIPKPVTHSEEGMIYTTYPSGRMTVQKIPGTQTPAEKEQSKSDIKKSQQLEDTADSLMDYAYNNEKISDILERNKNATGNIPALRNFLNLAGEDAGEFNNLAIPMQGKLAKDLSNRGGAVVAKLAAGGKYNLAKDHAYNTGIRKSTTNDIINTYDLLNERYKRLTGKELPQKLSPFYENWRKSGNTTGRLKFNPSTGRLE
jgi:hypothetical protein